MNPKSTEQTLSFEKHYRVAVLDLRNALADLLASVSADPTTPQELARRFGLNRNLTWKVSRLVRSADPVDDYSAIPGSSAVTIFLKALQEAGAPRESAHAVREAVLGFDAMVKAHAGDRANLELMLDGLAGNGAGSEPLEISRKLAFRGNSGILGLQARLRLRSLFIAPNAGNPDLVDTAELSGLVDVRRFRNGAVPPLFETVHYNDDGSAVDETTAVPLEPEAAGYEGSLLMPSFCSTPLPPLEIIQSGGRLIHVLGAGSIGNRGAVTAIYGSLSRGYATRYQDENNRYGECLAAINVPSESLLLDLVVHKDVTDELLPEVKLYQGINMPHLQAHAAELPCPESIQDLGSGPPRLATSLMPRYSDLTDRVFARSGWDPHSFRAMRLELKYPPVNSSLLVRFELPKRR